jgi:hypothetical protein
MTSTITSISFFLFIIILILTFIIYFELFFSIIIFKALRKQNKTTALVTEAIYFFAKELELDNKPNILVEAKYPSWPTFVHGYMSPEKTVDDIEHYKVVVHLNRNMASVIRTVAHEMVHVKQFNKKELKYVGSRISWKGDLYKDNHPYHTRPWEIEAFGMDKELSEKFLAHKNIKVSLVSKIYNFILLDLFSI